MATRSRRPEPTTAERDALKTELRQIDANARGAADARNAAFREQWAAKMNGIAPTEQPPIVRVTWSMGMR